MAIGYEVFPMDEEMLTMPSMTDWLAKEGAYLPPDIVPGRSPTTKEIRDAIQDFEYTVETRASDLYVTSQDDFTEIWLRDYDGRDDQPIGFHFRRGSQIVLDLAQAIAQRSGTLFVVGDYDGIPVLLVPDSAFPDVAPPPKPLGFFETTIHRAPALIRKLEHESTPNVLFILAQFHQALRKRFKHRLDEAYRLDEALQKGMPEYLRLLEHADARVRSLAFDLVTAIRERSFERWDALQTAIAEESEPNTRTHMIGSLDHVLLPPAIDTYLTKKSQGLISLMEQLVGDEHEPLPVRFAAARLLAHAQPGMLSQSMRSVLLIGLTAPEKCVIPGGFASTIFEEALKVLDEMLINHRIQLLLAALPDIKVAEDAHDAARALLDYAFFGAIHPTQMDHLPESYPAERTPIAEGAFRSTHVSQRLYPVHPTRLDADALLPHQREIVEAVIKLDLPWMVHSNLLEKYGLPPTRQAVRELLSSKHA